MAGADVFIGVSVKNLVTREMVKSMADRPIVFALANPDPEIPYPEARAARPDAIVATGRSDYPNQVNNVLGFPFIFRGALDNARSHGQRADDGRGRHALAELAREEVDESVARAYGGIDLRFGPGVHHPEAVRLARAAPRRRRPSRWPRPVRRRALPDHRRRRLRGKLERLLGKEREVMRFVVNRAKVHPKRVVFADGEEEKVLRAAHQVLDEGIAQPVLVGRVQRIPRLRGGLGLDLGFAQGRSVICDPQESPLHEELSKRLHERRARKGTTLSDARRHLRTRLYFASSLVQAGHADGMVAGLTSSFPETLRPVLRVVGTAPSAQRVAGCT
jgi:malate dehydrogenase (oxaloacetate-decarboxylating)(NADP+)